MTVTGASEAGPWLVKDAEGATLDDASAPRPPAAAEEGGGPLAAAAGTGGGGVVFTITDAADAKFTIFTLKRIYIKTTEER